MGTSYLHISGKWGFPGASEVRNLPAVQEPQKTRVWSLGREDPLEEGMATHSSILAWRIPWMEEPSRLQFMGLQRVRRWPKRLGTRACTLGRLSWYFSYNWNAEYLLLRTKEHTGGAVEDYYWAESSFYFLTLFSGQFCFSSWMCLIFPVKVELSFVSWDWKDQ